MSDGAPATATQPRPSRAPEEVNPLVEGLERLPVHPTTLVIFGATGDLARRKLLPALYNLAHEGALPERFHLVGVSRSDMPHGDYREMAIDAVRQFSRREPDEKVLQELLDEIRYIPGSFDDADVYSKLSDTLDEFDEKTGQALNRAFYLSTAPAFFPVIVKALGDHGLQRHGDSDVRVIIEKPFGTYLEEARALNHEVLSVFDERQVFRIDHYLGKETVQNVLAFRFANGMFEPLWNRNYIDSVQITAAEDIGIGSRAGYYDSAGALRDLVQNHMLQLLCLLAMEPPVSFEPNRLRDEKVKVLQGMLECSPDRVVRGQYAGYRDEPDVARDSQTETFVALELDIDSWRWAGVPFFLRTGKKLKRKLTEVSLSFRDVPYNVFKGTEAGPAPRDHLTFRIQPNEG